MNKRSCDPQDMEVGRRIRARRLAKDTSQTDLATQLVEAYRRDSRRSDHVFLFSIGPTGLQDR